jgi:hypothetical protein
MVLLRICWYRRVNKGAKTDKRFLNAVLRQTDDHNRSVLRAQAEQAAAIQAEREEAERRDRRARAEEAAQAEKMRLRRLMGGRLGGSSASSSHRDRRGGRDEERLARKERDEDGTDRKRRKREGSRDRDDSEREEGTPWRERRRKDKARADEPDEQDEGHRSSKDSHSSKPVKPLASDPDDGSARKSRRTHSSVKTRSPTGSKSTRVDSVISQQSTPRSRSNVPDTEPGSPKLQQSSIERRKPSKRKRPSRTPSPGFNTAEHWRSSRSPGDTDTRSDRSRRRRSVSPTTLSDDEHGPRRHFTRKRKVEPRPPSLSPPPEPHSRLRGRGTGSAPGLSSKMDRYFESSYDPRLDVAKMSVPEIPSTGLIDDADFAGWEAMLELIKVRRVDKEERKWLDKHATVTTKSVPSVAGLDPGIMDIQYKKRGAVREWDMGKNNVD